MNVNKIAQQFDAVEARLGCSSKLPVDIFKGEIDLSQKYKEGFAKNIEQIIYLATPRRGMNDRDRTLLHWALGYAEKAQSYLEKYEDVNKIKLWIQLLQLRLHGSDSVLGGGVAIDYNPGVFKLNQKKVQRAEKKAAERLLELKQHKIDLTKRYNKLVLVRANRKAAASFQAQFGETLSEALSNELLVTFERILLHNSLDNRRLGAAYAKEAQKFNSLSTAHSASLKDAASKGYKKVKGKKLEAVQEKDSLLASFDLFSDLAKQIDPKGTDILKKYKALQVKRSNNEASETQAELPFFADFVPASIKKRIDSFRGKTL